MNFARFVTWRITAALLACAVTATLVNFSAWGPATKAGEPMDLDAGHTPARIQFDRMLAAFNSGDRAAIDAYRAREISPYWTHSPTTAMALGWFKKTGGYRALKIHDRSPYYLDAVLRSADSDDLFIMGVEVERMQPHRLMYLRLNYAMAPEEFRIAPLADQQLIEALRDDLARRVPAGKFSGAILVQRDELVLFREAFGFADRESRVPNTVTTRFRIGQLTNLFTAVAILRLAEDGRLQLTDRLGSRLPEFANDDVGDVTLEQLLTNSGGTHDLEHLGAGSPLAEQGTLAQAVDEFGDAPLRYRPGKAFMYSSLGFALLGAVIERVSGQSYEQYVRRVVLQPAGMNSTELTTASGTHRRALPYRRPAGTATWSRIPGLFCCRGTAIGDAHSTVDDIARFLRALSRRQLLDDAHTRRMLEPRVHMWAGAFHALGITVERYSGNQWISYEDGLEGQNSGFMYWPESGQMVVVLGNFDAPYGINVVRFVGNRLTSSPELERNLVRVGLQD